MSSSQIVTRLAQGQKLLLDGGTGSELQRRGVDISRRAADGGLGAWSATANVDAPHVVRAVHEDYLRSGADIITSNSFWSNRTRLGRIGQADQMEEYTRISVELARDAIDTVGSDAYVAGSMAPPDGRPKPGNTVTSDDLAAEFKEQAAVLAEAGADLILLEYVSSIDEASTLVGAAAETGLPVFLGLKHFDAGGTLRSKESAVAALAAVAGLPVAAVLDMCSPPDEITAVLPQLRAAFEGPLGAYANIGYSQDPEARNDVTSQWHRIDTGDNTPDRYAEYARGWLTGGAQIIGGCCASTPEHIAALRALIPTPEH
jgi:S-methylmethionine-dependent homocysteine/selenocysteine methylase